jgi:hypothetical protein
MKWLIIIVMAFLLSKSTAQSSICNLGDFKYIALTTHDPYDRKEKIIRWIKKNGDECNKEDIAKIYNSLAHLLGTSDDGEIRGLTYELYINAKSIKKN